MAEHEITLGSLVLSGDASMPDLEHGYWFEVAAEGTNFGSPQAVSEVVRSMLSDGDLVRITRFGNREVPIRVMVHGPDLASVAQGEAALRRELGKANTLVWQPPDSLAPPSVFDVITSWMDPAWNDLDEMWKQREFRVTLTCDPRARSAELTTVAALEVPSSETVVNVDTCDSATGWSASYNGLPADVSTTWQPGAVSVLDVLQPGGQTLTLTRTGFINFSTTPYLRVDIGYRADLGALPVTVTVGGALSGGATLKPLEQRMTSPGRFIFTYDTGGVTVESLTFTSVTSTDTADLKIFNVARTDMPPMITARQAVRIIEAGGTERTPASIHVATPNGVDGLGLTIVHTSPEDGSGYSPPLRRWRVSGNAEVSASDTFSGKYEAIHASAFVAEVPNSSLPAGGYALVAALKSDTVGTFDINWSLQSVFPPSTEGEGGLDGFVPVQFYLANVWHFVPLALASLPTIRSTGGAVTKVAIQYQGANPPTIIMDDAWLFRVDDDCGLSVVNIAPGYVWLDSPDLDSPTPSVWWSGNADKSAARHPGSALLASGTHTLDPNGTAIFTATRNVDYPLVSASFYRRWHSNAAE